MRRTSNVQETQEISSRSVPDHPSVEQLQSLLGDQLVVTESGNGWPARGMFHTPTAAVPVAIYIRPIGRSGRERPQERRFQNPAEKAKRAILKQSNEILLLLGLWEEQGPNRTVLVGMDAYKRVGDETRCSLFMPMSLLEEAADTGYATHRSGTDEILHAFRPGEICRYIEELASENPIIGGVDAPLLQGVPGLNEAQARKTDKVIHIRPKVGMYTAFARLNYKPWYALAEFIDNSLQSFLANRDRFRSTAFDSLLVDIYLDDDELTITDRAAGIALSEFDRAFSPSQPPPDASGLSEFGLGMKAAACWFSRTWTVQTSALGEGIERIVKFDVESIAQNGFETLPVLERPAAPDDHFTKLSLTNLRYRLKGRTIGKIKEHLASIYRVYLRSGILRIRFTTPSSEEELSYEDPPILEAPYFREPGEKPRIWRKEIDLHLPRGRKVTGWAGLIAVGSVSTAGFAVLRRGRLIQGSVDETYRPKAIFRFPNSYTYQRLVGELIVEGFDVSHTKDGIQWDEQEDSMLELLRAQLDSKDLPLLQQAEGYRARRAASTIPENFGSSAIISAGKLLESQRAEEVVGDQLENDVEPGDPTLQTESVLQNRTFTIAVPRSTKPWRVSLQLINDRTKDLYGSVCEEHQEELSLSIYLNLAHPFCQQFVNESEENLGIVLRMVMALSISEQTLRLGGDNVAGRLRRATSELLGDVLSTIEEL